MNHNRHGFTVFEAIISLAVLVLIVLVGWWVWQANVGDEANEQSVEDESESTQETALGNVVWQHDGSQWKASKTPPSCPGPLFITPVDLSKVESILYPGQYRGNHYKAHGGFRFDEDDTAVNVYAPLDAVVVLGAQYKEGQSGEVQYLFEFHHDCGIAYRFDHLFTLSDKLANLAEQLPEPKQDDSRTTNFDRSVVVEQGEPLATMVGLPSAKNIFVDWGVYDLRSENQASQSTAFREEHKDEQSQAYYGVCWPKLLPMADSETVLSLPPTSAEGDKSDYC